MLSRQATEILQWLAQEGDDENGYERELVREGRTWYLGCKKVSGTAAKVLISLVLLHLESDAGDERGLERWTINAEGRKMLSDSTYKPEILPYLKELVKKRS